MRFSYRLLKEIELCLSKPCARRVFEVLVKRLIMCLVVIENFIIIFFIIIKRDTAHKITLIYGLQLLGNLF